jgi:hypothetical protein
LVAKGIPLKKSIQVNQGVTDAEEAQVTKTITRKRGKVTETYVSEVNIKLFPPHLIIKRKAKQINTTESITRQ